MLMRFVLSIFRLYNCVLRFSGTIVGTGFGIKGRVRHHLHVYYTCSYRLDKRNGTFGHRMCIGDNWPIIGVVIMSPCLFYFLRINLFNGIH